MEPIGYVKRLSKFEDVKDETLECDIIIYERFLDALEGIESFSHIFVIYWLHLVSEDSRRIYKVHPKGKRDLPLVGVFSTRSPNRPNPIGLTLVELLARRSNILTVRGLDALDETPVLDLKPYSRHDKAENFKAPDWWGGKLQLKL